MPRTVSITITSTSAITSHWPKPGLPSTGIAIALPHGRQSPSKASGIAAMTTTGSIGTSLQMSRILVKNLMSAPIIAPYARIRSRLRYGKRGPRNRRCGHALLTHRRLCLGLRFARLPRDLPIHGVKKCIQFCIELCAVFGTSPELSAWPTLSTSVARHAGYRNYVGGMGARHNRAYERPVAGVCSLPRAFACLTRCSAVTAQHRVTLSSRLYHRPNGSEKPPPSPVPPSLLPLPLPLP